MNYSHYDSFQMELAFHRLERRLRSRSRFEVVALRLATLALNVLL